MHLSEYKQVKYVVEGLIVLNNTILDQITNLDFMIYKDKYLVNSTTSIHTFYTIHSI